MNKRKKLLILIAKKMLVFFVSIFALSIIAFSMSRIAPGDPLVSYYGDRAERMNTEEREHAIHRLGLDGTLTDQYVAWFKGAIKGDFGESFKYKENVLTVIAGRLVNTLLLGGIGFLLTFFLALLLGILCALHEGDWLDTLLCKVGTITSCIPEFWLSLVLILIFSVTFHLLPSSGAFGLGEADSILSRIRHMILPMVVIVLSHLWYYAYLIRNKLIDEKRKEYVLMSKSMGLTNRQVMWRHCVRNIMPAFISIMAISLNHVLEGTYIVEMVYSYPGIGTLSFESAKYHDYNMLMVLVIIMGVVVILGNIIGQIISENIDHRMKEEAIIEDAEVVASEKI
ncbi:MAG: ABC transporter permease [Lachnospiraceae bacterium]|nr:ABC transporter permease [Lachnospiraceae bacterium]